MWSSDAPGADGDAVHATPQKPEKTTKKKAPKRKTNKVAARVLKPFGSRPWVDVFFVLVYAGLVYGFHTHAATIKERAGGRGSWHAASNDWFFVFWRRLVGVVHDHPAVVGTCTSGSPFPTLVLFAIAAAADFFFLIVPYSQASG